MIATVLTGCTSQKDNKGSISESISDMRLIDECLAAETCEEENAFKKISSESFQEKMKSKEYIVIDVRTLDEFEEEKLPGKVLNIDYKNEEFESVISKLDFEKKYLVYCRSANRSGMAIEKMKELGFRYLIELDGGILKWKEDGFDVK